MPNSGQINAPINPLPTITSNQNASQSSNQSSGGNTVSGNTTITGNTITSNQQYYVIGGVGVGTNTIATASQNANFANSIKKSVNYYDGKPFEVKDQFGNSMFSYDENDDGVVIEINKDWPKADLFGPDTRFVIMNEDDKLIITLKGARKMVK